MDFVGHGVHLPPAGAGGDDEEIDERCQFREVENDDLRPAEFVGDAGALNRSAPAFLDLSPAFIVDVRTAGTVVCRLCRGVHDGGVHDGGVPIRFLK